MSQPTPEPTPAGQEPAPAAPTPAQPEVKKPWGDDSNFDPEKAWNLVENLRKEKVALQEKAAKFDEAERAKMSEVDQHRTAAEENKTKATKLERENAQLRAVLKYPGMTEAQAKRLTGETPDEILADAAEFAKELGLTTGDNPNPEAEPEKPQKDITSHHRPTQQPEPVTPRGGRTPSAEPEEDLSEIIASIPR